MGEEFKGLDESGGSLVAVERSRFMPAMSIESAVERYRQVTEFVSRVLRNDVAYGVIADQVNTIQKMAQKRSLVAAVLIAVNASEFFTQDVEDMPFGAAARDAVAAETQRVSEVTPTDAQPGGATADEMKIEAEIRAAC